MKQLHIIWHTSEREDTQSFIESSNFVLYLCHMWPNHLILLLHHQPEGKWDLRRQPDLAFWDLENKFLKRENFFHEPRKRCSTSFSIYLGSSRGGWRRRCELLFLYRSLESLYATTEEDDKHAVVSPKLSIVMNFPIIIKGTEVSSCPQTK